MNRIKYPWLKKYIEHFDINKLAHSHLFSGKTGIGKLHFTEELSKSLLCSNSNELFEYCNDCSSCKAFNAGSHPDFKLIDKETDCLLYTSPSPRDVEESRMPSSA